MFLLDGLDDVLFQHEVLDVFPRDNHTVRTVQSALLADVEKTFDFLVDPADDLYTTMLVYGAGHGEILPDRNLRQ